MDKDCLKLIKSRVWSWHRKTGIDFDELESEAIETYVKCLASFDESKDVKFTTYLYNGINMKLQQFCRDWYDQLPAIYIEDAETSTETYDEDGDLSEVTTEPLSSTKDLTVEKLMFEQWRQKLTPKAQAVCEILDSCADDLIKYVDSKISPHSPKLLKGALKRYLLQLNWRESDIDRTFAEIERKLVMV